MQIFSSSVYFLEIHILGPLGNDGTECPAHCPTQCSPAYEMQCPGGQNWNGCQEPDFCVPSKGDYIININLKLFQLTVKIF